MAARRKTEAPRWIDEAIEGLREVNEALVRGERLEDICPRVEHVVRPPAAYPARRVKALRHRLGVSQTAFAEILAVTPKTVQTWEREGVTTPAMRRLLEFAEHRYSPKPARRRVG
jgi:DNA-binding transcriptional regulator YiaG